MQEFETRFTVMLINSRTQRKNDFKEAFIGPYPFKGYYTNPLK